MCIFCDMKSISHAKRYLNVTSPRWLNKMNMRTVVTIWIISTIIQPSPLNRLRWTKHNRKALVCCLSNCLTLWCINHRNVRPPTHRHRITHFRYYCSRTALRTKPNRDQLINAHTLLAPPVWLRLRSGGRKSTEIQRCWGYVMSMLMWFVGLIKVSHTSLDSYVII